MFCQWYILVEYLKTSTKLLIYIHIFLLQYEGINIPYPVDKTDMLKQIEADQKSAVSEPACSALPS